MSNSQGVPTLKIAGADPTLYNDDLAPSGARGSHLGRL